jgi:hypothetical protein
MNFSSNSLVCFLVACAFALPTMVHAQIGESLKEFRTRYGSPVLKSKDRIFGTTHVFRDGNISVHVTFLDGKAASVTYMKQEVEEGNLLLTKQEIKKLIDRNSSKKLNKVSGAQQWKSADGKIVAEYDDKNASRALSQPPYNLAIGVLSVESSEVKELRKQRTDEYYSKQRRSR